MKKLTSLTIGLLLFTPVLSHADTLNPNAALIKVLQQLVLVLEQEIQQLLAAQSQTSQPTFGSIQEQSTSTLACVESPKISLIPSTTSISSSGTFLTFIGNYSTGCPLPSNLNWSFQGMPDDTGTLSANQSSHTYYDYVDSDGLTATFHGQTGGYLRQSTTFMLEIGNASTTVSLPVEAE